MDFIIDNWTDLYIEILIYQNEEFRYVIDNISKLKESCNKKNIPVYDDKILIFTKVFNDKVLFYFWKESTQSLNFESYPSNFT